jgi:hypothetical protein
MQPTAPRRADQPMHVYEVRPRKDKRGIDLIFRRATVRSLVGRRADAISNAVGYAKFRSRSHDGVIRVCDEAGNVIQTHEHKGDSKSGEQKAATR